MSSSDATCIAESPRCAWAEATPWLWRWSAKVILPAIQGQFTRGAWLLPPNLAARRKPAPDPGPNSARTCARRRTTGPQPRVAVPLTAAYVDVDGACAVRAGAAEAQAGRKTEEGRDQPG